MDVGPVHCSACGASSSLDSFMSNSQRKKDEDKRRCIKCVNGTMQGAASTLVPTLAAVDTAAHAPVPPAQCTKKRPLPPAEAATAFAAGGAAAGRASAVAPPAPPPKKAARGVVPSGAAVSDGEDAVRSAQLMRLDLFYATHCPKRCGRLEQHGCLLDKFKGREEKLFKKLKAKYASVSGDDDSDDGGGGDGGGDGAPPPKKAKKTAALAASAARTAATGAAVAVPPAAAGPMVCDKCDGPHASSACPHFKKGRDNHPDAQRRKITSMGGDGGNVVLTAASVARQPVTKHTDRMAMADR